jgi:hypothetical protein
MPENLRQQILNLCESAAEKEYDADAAQNIMNIVHEIQTLVEEA